ncbi:MAG: chromosome segregation SMC family protein [Patescibacteria group bacterium]
MYLKRLELQGFKTFAQKTVLEFELDKNGRRGVTSIVGPNGSGKSNIADAARWVMGEQSLKLLRSKKSEDVIFSGSEKKSRSGFAEVSMTLVNDDNEEIDFSEILITRRLYRDGQSEYEINKQSARLSDVVMLLAQCGIGQRTYSVIGQGMVDEVLSSTPTERKVFFDEAAGLRPFQLKRQASVNKLDSSRDNLRQSEALIREIQPRLQSLERQVKRLEKRESLEQELQDLQTKYYGGMWRGLQSDLIKAKAEHDSALKLVASAAEESEKLEAELKKMETANPPSEEFGKLRESLNNLMEERSKIRERQMKLETSREVAKVRAEKPWAPLPLSKIISGIENLNKLQDGLLQEINVKNPDLAKVKSMISDLQSQTKELIGKLQRPAPEPDKPTEADPKLEKEIADIIKSLDDVNHQIQSVQTEIGEWNNREQKNRSHIFELQRELSRRRTDAQSAERKAGDIAVSLARIETKRDGFLQDVRANIPDQEPNLDELAKQVSGTERPEEILPRITKLRAQLEWIGGIDPETIKEYDQTKARYEELTTQSQDLVEAMASLETIIKELDQTIAEKSKTAFLRLNQEFGLYFKKIFGGGEAALLEVYPEPEVDEEGNVTAVVDKSAGPSGVEIQATPPGKRLKAIALLSGGERALISIALICAIMATNPSPFVVLDEVDAALDESNSHKFAEIINTLADRTQFVIITHNRATMERANILYGVTMGEGGSSKLISVKLKEILKQA